MKIIIVGIGKLGEYLTPVHFERCSTAKLAAWVQKHFLHNGIEASPALCSLIPEYCGHSMYILANEIDKLSFYLRYHGKTVADEESMRHVCTPLNEYDTYAFTNAIMAGRSEEALAILEKMLADAEKNGEKTLSGENVFKLYDTYGFPLELTLEYAEELGLTVDQEGFKAHLNEQKERARNARKDEASMGGQNEEFLKFKEETRFSGYHSTNHKARVVAIFGNGVVLDETPFYAFSGGQLCDIGTLDDKKVIDVIKMPNGQHLHKVELVDGKITINENVEIKIVGIGKKADV